MLLQLCVACVGAEALSFLDHILVKHFAKNASFHPLKRRFKPPSPSMACSVLTIEWQLRFLVGKIALASCTF